MKTLLILGSNSHVGQACAYKFAENGFNMILASRNVNDYQKRLASDISLRYNIEVKTVYFDASRFDEHQEFYETLPFKPDVVLSVFGYLGDHDHALSDFKESSNIIVSNFTGNVSILNIVANDMENRKSGIIIGVSSVAGDRGRKSNYIYGASKAGLTAYLSGLRNRLSSSNVHVATVIPGFIRTKMIEGIDTPKRLTAQPEQVANTIWKSCKNKKNIVYVLGIWRIVMFVIRNIPEKIFKRLNL